MRDNQSLSNKIYNFLINPNIIIKCGILLLILYPGLIILGIFIAMFFGTEGYSIYLHYISDLGSIKITPTPFLYDIACIIAGSLSLPFLFYLEKIIAPIPINPEELPAPHRWVYRLMGAAFISYLLGCIFYIGVGIFSADRNYFYLHDICSYGAFAGYIFAELFLGLLLIFSKQKFIPKVIGIILGIFGLIFPVYIGGLNILYGGPFYEWLLLIVILIWMIPINIFLILNAKREINKRNNIKKMD